MKIKSKIEGAEDWLFIEEIPEMYIANTPLSEKNINIKMPAVNKLVNYQLSSGGLFLVHSTMQFNENVKVLSEVEGETITSQFIFYGTSPGGDKNASKNSRRMGSRHNIRYIPSLKGKYPMVPGVEYKYFCWCFQKPIIFI